jgi:hypothetical protein
MKQTAVEWIFLMLNDPNRDQGFAKKIYDKAKEIEQEQIEEAFNSSYWFIDGREYYEKTYGIHD